MKNKLFIGLTLSAVLSMSGCSQVNDLVNANKASHTNTATNSNAAANTNENSNANSNVNSNTAANSNANVSDKNSNAPVANSNVSTEPAGTPKPPEVKAFESNLNGSWVNSDERAVFTKDEIKFYSKSTNRPGMSWKYTAVDAKTVEITDENGQKSKATMTFENNNTTLKWKDKMGEFTYEREAAKP